MTSLFIVNAIWLRPKETNSHLMNIQGPLHFSELQKYQAQGEENFSYELFLEKGDKVSPDFLIHGDVFNHEEASSSLLEITKDIFMKVQKEGTFFSFDGEHWKSFEELFTKKDGFFKHLSV